MTSISHGKAVRAKGSAKPRTTKSFLQAARWTAAERRKTHPGEEREAARRSIMDACRWADALVKRWDASGQPGLMTIRSSSQLEFELFSETLARCFVWYKFQPPNIAWEVEVGS